MDTYPSEFTAHVHPLMFIAGLGQAPPPGSAATPDEDDFAPLMAALRKTMAPRKNWSIWDSSRGSNNDFHAVLVDKNVRFPPLKARPPSNAQQPYAALHSPISPLSPSSPLYPDGIMAPIWVRKHREMVPSVFVLVLRLGEYRPETGGPLDEDAGAAKEDAERTWDAELVAQVGERKRSTVERGIKLAVVLVCSRALLEDPGLDGRLSLIRRQSGLDARASLFVISPVPPVEVQHFVASFRAELFPAAVDYYREHGRRVRRKRARQPPKGKLNDRGWSVRYDYKMGIFAEMRHEMEVALKHYEDAYEVLLEMFTIPTLLPPRTKRWAEAKVLADCLTVKICKIYLYNNESARCMSHFNKHIAAFRELSEGWGIGENSFEFWSWLSKQYRLIADLVGVAVRSGFRLPSLKPPPSVRPTAPGAAQPASPSLIPPNVILHPGFYFYMAALCAVQRRDRFRDVAPVQQEEGTPISPAIAHEMKVDHAEMIVDLFTKAYEFFKAHKTSRMSLFLASQIAVTHRESGKHDLALKFNERISKTYRREKWSDLLDHLTQQSHDSALHQQDPETSIRSLFALLAPESKLTLEERGNYAKELLDLLRTSTPPSPETNRIAIDAGDSPALLDVHIAFWHSEANLGDAVPFQIAIDSLPGAQTAGFTFSRVEFAFNDGRPPFVVENEESGPDRPKVLHRSVGQLTDSMFKAPLTWPNDSTLVLNGAITVDQEIELTLISATFILKEGPWEIALTLRPGTAKTFWRTSSAVSKAPLESAICSFRRRVAAVTVNLEHAQPAYLDDDYSIAVIITNDDEEVLEVTLDLLLHPSDESSFDEVTCGDQTSTSLIKAVPLGRLSPGVHLTQEIILKSTGAPGERHLDFSIHATPVDDASSPRPIPAPSEITRTITIPVVPPFFISFDTHFHRTRRPARAIPANNLIDPWDSASQATLIGKVTARGPWELEILSLRLLTDANEAIRIARSSLDMMSNVFPLHWAPRDSFNAIFELDMLTVNYEPPSAVEGAVFDIAWKRLGASGDARRTTLQLDPLRPRPLHALVTTRLPSHLVLNKAIELSYRLTNPTDVPIKLSLQLDASDNFVLSGARKFPPLILAPGEERQVRFNVIPLIAGPSVLPRLRAYEHQPRSETLDSDEDAPLPPPRELLIVTEPDGPEVQQSRNVDSGFVDEDSPQVFSVMVHSQ